MYISTASALFVLALTTSARPEFMDKLIATNNVTLPIATSWATSSRTWAITLHRIKLLPKLSALLPNVRSVISATWVSPLASLFCRYKTYDSTEWLTLKQEGGREMRNRRTVWTASGTLIAVDILVDATSNIDIQTMKTNPPTICTNPATEQSYNVSSCFAQLVPRTVVSTANASAGYAKSLLRVLVFSNLLTLRNVKLASNPG
ncbi:hypothetical protein G6011_00519 [Alternaria panax]|uniref:Uncharacterized protein n=1 Tax=Alternaria panax TaxID=48097 RepID=A0AAD4NV25_9PLEO|nr:hypothetical protein G6011_00519 [Alternaria panax]